MKNVYIIQRDGDWADEYEALIGPDGFECVLTEPEDRCWTRDLGVVVQRLNEQHQELQAKRESILQQHELYTNAVNNLNIECQHAKMESYWYAMALSFVQAKAIT